MPKSLKDMRRLSAEVAPSLREGSAKRGNPSRREVKAEAQSHELNCYEIDSLDEIDEGCQLALVWCETHRKYEWHSISLDLVKHGGTITTTRKPVFT